jgi:hypothetical protein
MKILKIKVLLRIGLTGAERKDIIDVEVPNGASEQDIETLKNNALSDWANNFIETSWDDV